MDNNRWTPEKERIERLAYVYWEQRGCEHGCHEDDWVRAEEEVRRSRRDPMLRARRTVVGVFHSLVEAQNAYNELKSSGFSGDDVSFVANKSGLDVNPEESGVDAEVAVDAGIGAAMGGVGGLLLGFAGLAVPGVGPVLMAGPIIAALGGAGVGAAAGGLIGALTEGGISEEDAAMYSEGVRRGHVLLAVHASGDRADNASAILDRNGAVNIDDRVISWRKRGWTQYDPQAEPLSADELRRERDYYKSAEKQGKEWSKRGKADRKSHAAAEAVRLSRIYQRA